MIKIQCYQLKDPANDEITKCLCQACNAPQYKLRKIEIQNRVTQDLENIYLCINCYNRLKVEVSKW